MRSKISLLEGLDILGNRGRLSANYIHSTAFHTLKLEYLPLFAGAAALLISHPQYVWARSVNELSLPPRVAKKAQQVERLISGCSKPALLRRQSEYRLPRQKAGFDMLKVFAGSDNCPGTPIPAGSYTSAAPYIDSGNTIDANNTVANEGCFYNYYGYGTAPGPDNVYSFTISARGANPQILVSTSSNSYRSFVYVLNGLTGVGCPLGTDNTVASCLTARYSQAAGGDVLISSSEMSQLPLNVPLHLFIDSGWSSSPNNAGPYTIRMQDVTIANSVFPPANDAPVDMNGDGSSDFVIIRNNGGQLVWYTRFSDDTFGSPVNWGVQGDIPVPEDYDGDGKDDFAVWRPGPQGRFYIWRSLTQTIQVSDFGQAGDDPTVVADYTGDGLNDLAVYRDSTQPGGQSYWYFRSASTPGGIARVAWGKSGDRAAPGDYDGDGWADFAVQRAEGSIGRFYLRTAAYNGFSSAVLGLPGDTLVPGDYDGDGKTDFAVARPGEDGIFVWDYRASSTPDRQIFRNFWGVAATDILAQGDYDGDGETELAIWRPGSPGTFFRKKANTGEAHRRPWGQPGDVPAASFNTR